MGALPRLELRCFGPPTALSGGRAAPSDVLWPKHLALLIYLALSPDRRRSREHLKGVFWGESTQDKAGGTLNQTLSLLRKALGDKRLPNDEASVVLSDEALEVDALRLPAMIERSPADAVALLRKEFLEGFNVRRAPGFEEWVAERQRDYAEQRVRALSAAGTQRLAEGHVDLAADHAREALNAAPHSETVLAILLQALALAGDRTGALAAFQVFAERLKRDVGELPSKSLLDLVKRIRDGSLRPDTTKDTPRDPLLVGRAAAHREIFEALQEGLAAGPRTIVITGEPGMGRSRLLAECVARGILKGAHTLRARQLESDHDARWSLLRQVFREGLVGAPGLAGARPEALAVLATFVPELAARFTPQPAHDVAEVGAAVAAVLGAIADEAPLLLALDDVHWADGASLAALHTAVRSQQRARVVLAVTAATGMGEPPKELRQLEADVGGGLSGVAVSLEPLGDRDVRALVAALAPWCQDEVERDRLARRLMVETAGNVFFGLTLLSALERVTRLRNDLLTWPLPERTTLDPLPISVPSVVRRAVEVRITDLDDTQRAILRAAAIGSASLDLPFIMHLSGRTLDEVEKALATLERRHLVKFDGTRYTFVAPLVALVVREGDLTPGERRRIEARAVEYLAERQDLESQALRCELLARLGRAHFPVLYGGPDREASSVQDYFAATLRAARAEGAVRLERRVQVALDRFSSPSAPPRQN